MENTKQIPDSLNRDVKIRARWEENRDASYLTIGPHEIASILKIDSRFRVYDGSQDFVKSFDTEPEAIAKCYEIAEQFLKDLEGN